MRLLELRIDNFRLIRSLELALPAGWNVFSGPNGAGKTSLLEAIYLLSHGRSFRQGAKEALAGPASDGYAVHATVQTGEHAPVRIGLARSGGRLEARVNGLSEPLSEMIRHNAVACFEPGSHALIAGPSDERRRFLDWGVFHVERGFLVAWRRCQRALKQRNAVLRQDPGAAELAAWDHELAEAAAVLTRLRCAYIDALRPILIEALAFVLAELGEPALCFDRGWNAECGLLDVLRDTRDRDLARGFTGRGPQRADWSITFDKAPRREHLSRGQEKLCALACVLAQARLHAARTGDWPILCLDDLASELDQTHQVRVLRALAPHPIQLLLTGTFEPAGLDQVDVSLSRFHVEQGEVRALL